MASFGSALRRTREEKGISLDEIAGETRLSKRYLLALEDEAIHKLPGGTYNRAYLRSYAGYLGLDTERLVREYSLEEAHQTEIGRLQPQPDVLTSIGKAVESRHASDSASYLKAWLGYSKVNVRVIAVSAPAVLLLMAGVLWLSLRTGAPVDRPRQVENTANLPGAASEDRPAAPEIARPDRVAAAPSDETLPLPRTDQPQAPVSADGGSSAIRPLPPSAPPLVPPTTVDPPSENAAAEAASREAASKARSASRAAKGRRLSVTDSGVGSDVVDMKLVGESETFAAGTRVTFWTRVTGGRTGDTINHVWFQNGARIGTTTLRIGSADWRTQSRQLMAPGEWAVEARDADGRVLVRHKFRSAGR